MSDLKPCPFCGGVSEVGGFDDFTVIRCSECGASTDGCLTLDHGIEFASELWNKRAQPTIADYLEANKEMIDKTGCKVVTIASLREFGGLKNE